MRPILTLGIVLSVLIASELVVQGAAEKSSGDLDKRQEQKSLEICTQNLLTIGKAIQVYEKENSDFPEWLSELHPKYLSDANILLCPADKLGGKPIFVSNADPKMPVSYGYQFHPRYRESTQENLAMYGDVIPLARCRHHANQPFDCLNLGFSSKVYPSSHVWEKTPEEMYGTPEKAIEGLEHGLQQLSDKEKFLDVYPILARLYIKVGREIEVESLINRFKSVIKPDNLQAHFVLGDMLEMIKREEVVLAVFEKFEKQYPDNLKLLNRLAQIHWKLGNAKLAKEYYDKTDSKSELIGKFVPDFSATDLNGNPISLQEYRGKVVLLDFWGIWFGPSIAEMPNFKRVYDTYKDQGFDIIGVSVNNEESELRDYIKENDIQWRQIFSGERWEDDPLAEQYGIKDLPATWLIARDGTLISSRAKGIALEHLVVEALKDKPENQ